MRASPTALGWIDIEVSRSPVWDRAQMRRLARHLGYRLEWAPVVSMIPLVDVARRADVDTLIIPGPDHVSALGLNALLGVVDVETVLPRLSFHRWNLFRDALTVTDHQPIRDR